MSTPVCFKVFTGSKAHRFRLDYTNDIKAMQTALHAKLEQLELPVENLCWLDAQRDKIDCSTCDDLREALNYSNGQEIWLRTWQQHKKTKEQEKKAKSKEEPASSVSSVSTFTLNSSSSDFEEKVGAEEDIKEERQLCLFKPNETNQNLNNRHINHDEDSLPSQTIGTCNIYTRNNDGLFELQGERGITEPFNFYRNNRNGHFYGPTCPGLFAPYGYCSHGFRENYGFCCGSRKLFTPYGYDRRQCTQRVVIHTPSRQQHVANCDATYPTVPLSNVTF